MQSIGVDISIEDRTSISIAVGTRVWDIPPGPEPGTRMPKKKRPQII